ncbi:MAG: HIT family protein [Isosphaeraceae bacterium]
MADLVHDPRCIFCKIVSGAISSARVLETPHAVAFLDINPLNPGHTLLVPRSHHPILAELPEEIAAHAGWLLPRLCRAVIVATRAEGLNVIVNNGRVAGQTVDHVHWHIVPRFSGDPVHWPWRQGHYVGDEMNQMQIRIEGALSSEGNSSELQ